MRVQGQAIFNNTYLMLQTALDGLSFAYILLGLVSGHIAAGRLVPVLEACWPLFPRYHL